MSLPVTKDQVVERFNNIVMGALNDLTGENRRNNAFWYNTNSPRSGMTPHLGPRVEPDLNVSRLSSAFVASMVFNILHCYAMELTRVRQASSVWGIDGKPIEDGGGPHCAALHPRLAHYFPIPTQPDVGTTISEPQLNAFLNALASKVVEIRTSSQYRFTNYSCHTSCHTSCHGSRGRR